MLAIVYGLEAMRPPCNRNFRNHLSTCDTLVEITSAGSLLPHWFKNPHIPRDKNLQCQQVPVSIANMINDSASRDVARGMMTIYEPKGYDAIAMAVLQRALNGDGDGVRLGGQSRSEFEQVITGNNSVDQRRRGGIEREGSPASMTTSNAEFRDLDEGTAAHTP